MGELAFKSTYLPNQWGLCWPIDCKQLAIPISMFRQIWSIEWHYRPVWVSHKQLMAIICIVVFTTHVGLIGLILKTPQAMWRQLFGNKRRIIRPSDAHSSWWHSIEHMMVDIIGITQWMNNARAVKVGCLLATSRANNKCNNNKRFSINKSGLHLCNIILSYYYYPHHYYYYHYYC